jgi:hypothetical protein
MDDAALVGVVHGTGKRLDKLSGLLRRKGSTIESVGQAAAIAELQREIGKIIVLPDLINLHNIRMLQTSHSFGFGAKAGAILGARMATCQDHLERYQAIESDVSCLVNHTHPTTPQLRQDLVTANRPGDRRRWGCGIVHKLMCGGGTSQRSLGNRCRVLRRQRRSLRDICQVGLPVPSQRQVRFRCRTFLGVGHVRILFVAVQAIIKATDLICNRPRLRTGSAREPRRTGRRFLETGAKPRDGRENLGLIARK